MANRPLAECERRLAALEAGADGNTVLDRYRQDPAALLADAGYPPDPWQAQVLRTEALRLLLLCTRQAGKSTTSAALALRVALLEPDSLILLLSPSQRQSGELFRKFMGQYRAVGSPVPLRRETALTVELANGSRVVSLPESEETIRGYSGVRLLLIDEAARVSEALFYAVRPMLAVSGGRLVALSTPFGRAGWFYTEWTGAEQWQRVKITAEQCPRISPAFLAEERRTLGARWFRQEYFASFEEVIGAVFSGEDIAAAFSGGEDIAPLFAQDLDPVPEDDNDVTPLFTVGEL